MIAPLLPEHLADLRKSGLSDATIDACRLHSVPPTELKDCPIPGVVHALAFPYSAIDGTPLEHKRWKLFYEGEPGDKPKYWQPKGSDPLPYFAPLVDWLSLASNPTRAMLLTEGEKKALAACQVGLLCVALAGVWSWRTKLDSGERMVLPGLNEIIWKGRTVELVPDSDVWRPDKQKALAGFYALGRELQARGAYVTFAKLPEAA